MLPIYTAKSPSRMRDVSLTNSMSAAAEFSKNQQQWKNPQQQDSTIKSESPNIKSESKLAPSSSKRNGWNRPSISFRCRSKTMSPPKTMVSYDWEEFSSIEIEPERGGSKHENGDDLSKKRRASRRWSLRDLLYKSSNEGKDLRNESERLLAALPAPGPSEEKTKATKQAADQIGAGKTINGGSVRKKPSSASVSPASTPLHNNRNSKSSTGRNKVAVSGHELYYQANRAQAEELKRKSFLPYKQGLLGCLGTYPSTSNQHITQQPPFR